MTQNFISCRLEKHFDNPEKFSPERWLKSTDKLSKSNINPYLVLPFGHGMRSCIARRFAEQNMLVFLLRVISKFNTKCLNFHKISSFLSFLMCDLDYSKI